MEHSKIYEKPYIQELHIMDEPSMILLSINEKSENVIQTTEDFLAPEREETNIVDDDEKDETVFDEYLW